MSVRRFDLALEAPPGESRMWLGAGALAAARGELDGWCEGRSVFVVATPRVLALHRAALAALGAAKRLEILEVPEGEAAKTLEVAGRLWQELLVRGLKRDGRIVGFGGGSVGDLAGFVAATALRGVDFALWPTTLLAQVDASIGGKTAIDLPAGKNTVGAFHLPRFVVAEAEWLGTLEAAEARAGWVEAIKKALAFDGDLFARFEATSDLERGFAPQLVPLLVDAAAHKLDVVRRDPYEAGDRKLLNLGHTLGHAIETASEAGSLRHGECVLYGMLFALRLSVARGLAVADAARVRRLLARLEPPALLQTFTVESLQTLMARDKKAAEGGITWVLPRAIGRAELEVVTAHEVAALLPAFLADPWAGPDSGRS
jgi:3-dehydroquinate synthase